MGNMTDSRYKHVHMRARGSRVHTRHCNDNADIILGWPYADPMLCFKSLKAKELAIAIVLFSSIEKI